MKKCAELVDERALTQQKIDQNVKFTRKQLQRVFFFFDIKKIFLL
jgi:hypothetical protein